MAVRGRAAKVTAATLSGGVSHYCFLLKNNPCSLLVLGPESPLSLSTSVLFLGSGSPRLSPVPPTSLPGVELGALGQWDDTCAHPERPRVRPHCFWSSVCHVPGSFLRASWPCFIYLPISLLSSAFCRAVSDNQGSQVCGTVVSEQMIFFLETGSRYLAQAGVGIHRCDHSAPL